VGRGGGLHMLNHDISFVNTKSRDASIPEGRAFRPVLTVLFEISLPGQYLTINNAK